MGKSKETGDRPIKLDRNFWAHTVWSYGSFLIVAFSGFAINVSIGSASGPEALGVFNQIYAIFIVCAQCATLAIYDSALKHMAQYTHSPKRQSFIAGSAVLLTGVSGMLVALIVMASEDAIAQFLESPATAKGLFYAAPGIALFTVNKVMLGILNGQRRMRFYCSAQSVRVVAILLGILWVNDTESDIAFYGLCFTIAEIIIFPFLCWSALPKLSKIASIRKLVFWGRKHLHFGRNAFLNGLLIDSYMRVDIIMIGIFLSDEQVGIYSLAAIFIEGLIQIAAVVRNLANPILVQMMIRKQMDQLMGFILKMAGISVCATILVGGSVCLVFLDLTALLDPSLLEQSYPILLTLFFGIVYLSLFIPTDHILLQAGMPHKQSRMMTFNILSNVILNLILIPQYGYEGAAYATILAFGVASLNLMWMIRADIYGGEKLLLRWSGRGDSNARP